MEKETLRHKILEDTYRQSMWLDVLKEYFGARTIHQVPPSIILPSNELAKGAVELGSFYTKDERLVGLYEVQLKPKAWIQSNRVSLRNLLRNVYKYDVDAALIVFVQGNKWRFSYVSEIRTEEGRKFTEPKRFTYLFGEGETCRTASERITNLKNKSIYLADLFDAFNVEKLNKDFFKTYKDFYLKGVAELKNVKSYYKLLIDKSEELEEKQEKPIRDFVKKMLGRIVFLHFLQRKGWMGCPADRTDWKDGDKNFMLNLFSNFLNQKKFYGDCLTDLFFNTLNNAKRSNDIFKHTKTRVPFLNGGLFDDDQPHTNDLNFSSEYFANLFDFFEQYNFTIDENDPYDSEVGIDPEMLGHIFENLLEENKDKGTFYTPKEIVHFICKASLIEYLKQGLIKKDIFVSSSDEKAIEEFIRVANKGEEDVRKNFVRQHAAYIEKLLDDVKVCDPAIGSGAFPMGIMQEIYNAKMNLDWTLNPTKVKKAILQNSIYGVDIDNGAINIARLRFWLTLVVDEEEPQPLPNLDYKIMQGNSLKEEFEGIKLDRLLKGEEIIFENEHGQKDLFGRRKNSKMAVDFSDEKKEKLKKLLDEFYEPRPLTEKKALQKKIDKIFRNHIEYNIELEEVNIELQLGDMEVLFAAIKIDKNEPPAHKRKKQQNIELLKKKIAALNDKLKVLTNMRDKLERLESEHDNKPYFLWHVFFEDVLNEGGFDIIVGNPPYGAKLSSDDKSLFKQMYNDVHMRTPDSFNYFISKSLRLLKNDGVLSFIVPNNLLYQNENAKTRDLLINQNHLKKIINLGDNTFENADVPTCIFVALKQRQTNYKLQYSDFRNEHIKNIPFFSPKTETDKVEINQVPDLVLGVSSHSIQIMQTLESKSWKIDEIALEVASGISTGGDKIFRMSNAEAKRLNLEHKILRKVLVGGEIDKYKIQDTNHIVLYLDRTTPIEDYPNTKNYLKQFKAKLEERSETKLGIMPWYSMNRHRYPKLFEEDKIILRQTSDSIRAAFDDSGFYCIDSILIFKLQPKIEVSYKFALTILNSRLNNYIYKNFTQEEGRTFAQVKPQNVRKLFIPKISQSEQKVFEDLCDYMMFLCDENNPMLSSLVPNVHIGKIFEEVIDGCVYECYFGKHMEERKINILDKVRGTIQPIDNVKSKEAKALIINEVFQLLRRSESQIRNRMQLFVSSSPEFLKEIIQR